MYAALLFMDYGAYTYGIYISKSKNNLNDLQRLKCLS